MGLHIRHDDKQYFGGIYRGIVVDNDDSQDDIKVEHRYLGRLKVRIPQVYGEDIADEDLPWSIPCFPFMGREKSESGYEEDTSSWGFFGLPAKEEAVWIMFEHGDPDSPVWMGCWYGEVEPIPELGPYAREDRGIDGALRTPTVYPDIHVIKNRRNSRGMWIRWIGDRRLEIVFENQTQCIEFDGDAQQILIKAQAPWKVRIEGENIELNADDTIRMSCTDFQLTSEALSMLASTVASIIGTQQARLASDGRIDGIAPIARGFDSHG